MNNSKEILVKKSKQYARLIAISVVASVCMGNMASADEETAEAKIARAMSAAPEGISAKATIMDLDGTILREGSNGWTCLPGVGLIPGDKHPMCSLIVLSFFPNRLLECFDLDLGHVLGR